MLITTRFYSTVGNKK